MNYRTLYPSDLPAPQKSIHAIQPNKALQPTPSRFAGWGCSDPLSAAHLRVGLIARSGWLSLTLGIMKMKIIAIVAVALFSSTCIVAQPGFKQIAQIDIVDEEQADEEILYSSDFFFNDGPNSIRLTNPPVQIVIFGPDFCPMIRGNHFFFRGFDGDPKSLLNFRVTFTRGTSPTDSDFADYSYHPNSIGTSTYISWSVPWL